MPHIVSVKGAPSFSFALSGMLLHENHQRHSIQTVSWVHDSAIPE